MSRLAVATIVGALALLGAAAPARAEEPPNIQYRLHYSPAFRAQIERTPFDESGLYTDERADSAFKLEGEIVLFRYLGLSAARIPFYRQFRDDFGRFIEEYGKENLYSVTLYATEVRHSSWNVFAGVGWGEIPEYRIKVDGVRTDTSPLHRGLQLQRMHGGLEYTFDRLGIRLEVNQITAQKESEGDKAQLKQTFQFLTFFIPFN